MANLLGVCVVSTVLFKNIFKVVSDWQCSGRGKKKEKKKRQATEKPEWDWSLLKTKPCQNFGEEKNKQQQKNKNKKTTIIIIKDGEEFFLKSIYLPVVLRLPSRRVWKHSPRPPFWKDEHNGKWGSHFSSFLRSNCPSESLSQEFIPETLTSRKRRNMKRE